MRKNLLKKKLATVLELILHSFIPIKYPEIKTNKLRATKVNI